MKIGMRYTGLYAGETIDADHAKRIKISDEIDVLPCEAIRVTQIADDTYAGLRDKARRLETIGYDVCIDLGVDFYETP